MIHKLLHISSISPVLEIHSLYITSKVASLNGGNILFFITFTVVSFQVISLSIPTQDSIFHFLLISSL
jgi:hypothetical protein